MTYRINKVHVQPIAELLDARGDLVEVNLLLATVCRDGKLTEMH